MPQGLGRNLYPTLTVFENLDFFGRLFGQPKSERESRIARPPRRDRPRSLPRPAGRQAVGRHEAEALAVLLADPRSGPADPRRADHRRRPAVAAAVLGADRPHPRAPAADERDGRDGLHGGSGAVRLARRHGRRPRDRHRHAGGAEGARQRRTLDDAFISLLPDAKRAGHQGRRRPPAPSHPRVRPPSRRRA